MAPLVTGLLDGALAEAFSAAFGPVFQDAAIYRWSSASDGMGGGTSGFDSGTSVKAQLDQTTEAMQSADGYVDTDQRILVLANGVAPISTDDEIVVADTRWLIASVARDPAGAYYDIRGRRKAGA